MKVALAGKGGVGKTTISAWLGNWLANAYNKPVWMIDADPAISLGLALGFSEDEVPEPLMTRKELIHERIGSGLITLNPMVADLPDQLAVRSSNGLGHLNLMVMGGVTSAGSGCACGANVLSKEIIQHVVGGDENIIVDLEAGVEHLGRGTIESIEGLIIVTEPSKRSIYTAKRIAEMATELGIEKYGFLINRAYDGMDFTGVFDNNYVISSIPMFQSLFEKQLHDPSVLNLPDKHIINTICEDIISYFD